MNDNYIISGYEPKKMFEYFEDIASIPHGSKNESGIADYLCEFAREHGLDFYRDENNNVLIKKKATAGYENEPAILLQGHSDMVCEKNESTVHNFLKDPLKLHVENGILSAEGTTLGADNGVGVALMLYFLDDNTNGHPALECLFTSCEEIGLTGAKAFDCTKISAHRMINLDSSGEGYCTVGCAGACRTEIVCPAEFVVSAGDALEFKISGLAGGHSGNKINSGVANAHKLMGRLLLALRRENDFNLISINGGNMINAIPRECTAVITCSDGESMKNAAQKFAEEIRRSLVEADKGFEFVCEKTDRPEKMMDCESTRRITEVIGTVQNGVIGMSREMQGLVETSRNLGKIRTNEDGVVMTFSTRSSVESELDAGVDCLEALAEMTHSNIRHISRYPGWQYEKQSAIREKYAKVALRILGREPTIKATHGGLECGIIKHAIPDMDIIAIGPDMSNVHTPNETLSLESFARFKDIVAEIMKKD